MRGHKPYRSGAWRLVVFAGFDEETGRRVDVHETVPGPDNRAGAKAADARLAEIIAAVESGKDIPGRSRRSSDAITMTELAEQWQAAHRPRRNERTGDWVGWSPKTAKATADNFRLYILPVIGRRRVDRVTAVLLDDLYASLEARGLSAAVVVRCHSQLRAMFNWALWKKLVPLNPALAADPPKAKLGTLRVRPGAPLLPFHLIAADRQELATVTL